MFRFVVVLIVVTVNGYASSVEECSWGESYWCSSLENAERCGAFEHCKTTVWKNQILKADDSEICDFCKSFINDVAKFIKDNRTEQDILRFIKSACSMIPSKALADECSKLADKFFVQILETIVADLNPRATCALIGLCTGFEDTVTHSRLPKTPELHAVSSLKIRSEPICTDCKKFFTDIKNLVLGNATEAEVEALINQALCSKLGTYETMCEMLVKEYLPEIMALILTEFDPNLVCQSLGFCETTLKEAKTFLLKLRLKRSEFYKMVSMQTSNDAEDGCSICKIVMKDIRDLDRSAAVQREIKGFLKSEICSRLTSYKTQCENLVDSYGQIVFEILANELDPDSRCRSLGFCIAAGNNIRDPTREATPVKTLASGQIIADSPVCTICKFVVGRIDEMLKQNATKQEIIDALDKICDLLPQSMRDSCLSFVGVYGSFIIDMLIQELNPDLVCSTLKLCSEKPKTTSLKVTDATRESTPAKIRSSGQIIADSPVCTICKFVVGKIDEMLKQNATKQDIIDALDKICNLLPESMRDSCMSFVGEYASFIIDMLIQEMNPDLVCSTLRLCSENPKTTSLKVSGSTECVVCEAIVQYLEALLLDNSTLSAIEALVQKVCNLLPQSIKPECNFVVEKYGPFIIQYIATAMTPKSVCEHIGACPTEMIKSAEMAVLTKAKVIKSSPRLLGDSECSWGPKYWCSSKENAIKCQATKYCDQTGWGL